MVDIFMLILQPEYIKKQDISSKEKSSNLLPYWIDCYELRLFISKISQ